MDVGNMLIWFIRILLPIILFCVYFKLQAPKDNRKSGKGGPSYSRSELLAKRDGTLDCPAPEAVANIVMKECEASPATPARGRTGGKGKGRRDGGKGEKRGSRDDAVDADGLSAEARQLAAEQEAIRAAELLEKQRKEERMQIEALINQVALVRSERQRVFLPDGPPPPPPPLRQEAVCAAPEVSTEANIKAHSVLRGAMKLKRSEIVGVIHDSLLDQQVEIEESTYILMVELSLLAKELKLASDYLLKMELAGYVPEANLVDGVMDLFNQQKLLKEEQKAREKEEEEAKTETVETDAPVESPDVSRPTKEELEEVLAQTLAFVPNSSAPAFVPNSADSKMLSASAAPFVPPAPAFVSDMAQTANEFGDDMVHNNEKAVESGTTEGQRTSLRTKLKSSSKPFNPVFGSSLPFDAPFGSSKPVGPQFDSSKGFEPQFGMGQDQYMYSWTDPAQKNGIDGGYSHPMQGAGQYMYGWQVGEEQIIEESGLFPANAE